MSDTPYKKRPFIYTIEEKCTGCNKCINVCPVDCANQVYRSYDGVRKVKTDSEYCISCGACIAVCDHQARDYLDDTEQFFLDLAAGGDEPLTVVAAPSAQVHFPELKKLFGWLKSLGVAGIYDVSFGADIATWAYLRAREAGRLPASVIAQPCSSVVKYCLRYAPELLPALAPVHSPLICLGLYLRRTLGIKGRIAFLSPCVAKGEEIRDKNTGLIVQYNVTYAKLKDKLEREQIDLSAFPPVDFDGQSAGVGHVYSRPGGLSETIRITDPEIWIRSLDAVSNVYPYLQEYHSRLQEHKPLPELVDVLNCRGGCNYGTGTRRDVARDDVDYLMNQQKKEATEEKVRYTEAGISYAPNEYFDRHLNWQDFLRIYTPIPIKNSRFTDEDLQDIYAQLHKTTPEAQNINCHACGYGTCKRFAQALKLGLNVPESCVDYDRSQLKIDPLTKLLNHGGLTETLENLLNLYSREVFDLSLIMMDVDDFKSVNDTYGHDVGDIALKTVAEAIRQHIRQSDFAGRWGGDEYMIILPQAGEEDAARVAARIRAAVATARVIPGGAGFTASAGVTTARPEDSPQKIFKRADRALYDSKKFKKKNLD